MDELEWLVSADLTPPTVAGVETVDGKTIVVTFDEAVVEAEALTPANYVFSGGLTLLAVEKVTSSQFRLTTSLQTPGLTYNLTVSGIHDLNGNLI